MNADEDTLTTFSLEEPVPVFPLNGTVLLPYATLPLHIFEPRYRNLFEDALDSTGMVAMGTFTEDVSEDDHLYGAPPLAPLVGLGFVEQYRKLDDGRFVVVLRGLIRATIREEVESPIYRRVLVEPMPSITGDPERMEALRARLMSLLEKSKLVPDDERSDVLEKTREEPLERLVDELGAAIISDGETLEELLAEVNVAVRAERIIDHLETASALGLG